MTLIKTTVKNFLRHKDTDVAAGLTYYAMLAIFPAILALVSLLSIVVEPEDALDAMLDVLEPLVSDETLADLEPTLRSLTDVQGAPLVLAFGAVLALWSASGYVGGFGRAMNRVREVDETRPVWKLRPLMLLITLVAVVLNAIALFIIIVSGPIAQSVGEKLGVPQDTIDLWEIAKWPVLAIVVVIVVALLFHATPNTKTGRVRLLTPGAFLALLLWAAASTGFAYYVANFASYNKTYGSIAGVVVALLWLWLTNVALLLGAELDAVRDARKDAQKDERKAEAAMIAASGPIDTEAAKSAADADPEDLERLMAPAMVTSSRRRDKGKVAGSFPQKPGEPPYGPVTQPVPDED